LVAYYRSLDKYAYPIHLGALNLLASQATFASQIADESNYWKWQWEDSRDITKRYFQQREIKLKILNSQDPFWTNPSQPGFKSNGFNNGVDEVIIRNTGDYQQMTATLHHEFQHTIYNDIYGMQTIKGFSGMASELGVRQQMSVYGYLTEEASKINSQIIDQLITFFDKMGIGVP
jgi:hypothetical protein